MSDPNLHDANEERQRREGLVLHRQATAAAEEAIKIAKKANVRSICALALAFVIGVCYVLRAIF